MERYNDRTALQCIAVVALETTTYNVHHRQRCGVLDTITKCGAQCRFCQTRKSVKMIPFVPSSLIKIILPIYMHLLMEAITIMKRCVVV